MSIVALDLGGVIVDVTHQRCADALGLRWSACERAFFDDALHDHVTKGVVDGDMFVRTALSRLPVRASLSLATLRAAWSLVVEVTPEGRTLVEELLARGHRVHLWTNTDPIHLERMLAQLPAGVVAQTASYTLGAMKPEPEFFACALAHGVPALFLDDRRDIVDAARLAGVSARQVLGAAQARTALVEASLL